MDLPLIDDYRALFLNDTPMIDTRAPVEYAQGAFPHTQNLPLMSDEEREAVGTCYKEQGQDSAIALGLELVSGATKQQRVEAWARFVEQHPEGVLYCFRGGLRSRYSQQWLYEQTGIAYPRVKGGYKALRRFLINELEEAARQVQWFVLGGCTGTGKTLVINALRQGIDLEGIYHHRGSAFGGHAEPQPPQIDVENKLAIELLKQREVQGIDSCKLLLEDEGGNIGSRRIPDHLLHAMQQAPLVMLEAPLQERVGIVFDEYIVAARAEYGQLLGEEAGFEAWSRWLQASMDRIRKRLGGQRHQELRKILDEAINSQRNGGDGEGHRQWIAVLLEDYYDPMYRYQLEKRIARIQFRGDRASVKAYLAEVHGLS